MPGNTYSVIHRVHNEWQWPLSGVHPIMMEKLAQPGEGRVWCTPTPFHCIYHHVESCGVCFSSEGRYTNLISALPLYVLCGFICRPSDLTLSNSKNAGIESRTVAYVWFLTIARANLLALSYLINKYTVNTVFLCLISTNHEQLTTFGKWHGATVTSTDIRN